MKTREIGSRIRKFAEEYPVITVTGPRQSGKTTLCRALFPKLKYINLEEPDRRRFARDDPRAFLAEIHDGAILDEIQYVPELLSYIQADVDEKPRAGRFVLTGSQNLLLMQSVSQSLAGRTALATLLPFTIREAYTDGLKELSETMWRGFYPRVLDSADPSAALSFYISTYVTRDVRGILNVKDANRFSDFLCLCAGRTGQLLNYSALATDAGIAVNTAKDWISILETCYLVYRLRPWSVNIGKRIVKAPKLYFLDTGLACNLLGISTPRQLIAHPLRGAVFETMIIGEMLKRAANSVQRDNLCYFRTSSGHEVDVIAETPEGLELTEIKSGRTIASDWAPKLENVADDLPDVKKKRIIYGGDDVTSRHGIAFRPWHSF